MKQKAPHRGRCINRTRWAFVRGAEREILCGVNSARTLWWFQMGGFCESAFSEVKRDLKLEFSSYNLGGHLKYCLTGLKESSLSEHYCWPLCNPCHSQGELSENHTAIVP